MARIKDLTGQRFGKLVVISLDPDYIPKSGRHAKWLCKCDCGNYKIAQSNHLIAGDTTACSVGCKNRIEAGTRFGRLTVLEMTEERSKNGGSMMYKCKCDCGEELLVPATDLRAKRKSACSRCNLSFGEIIIEDLLKANGILYSKEHIFKDCYNEKTGQPFRFDFYLPIKNIVIEYDGEQHSKVVKSWGGEEGLKERQRRDRIKTNYCLDNGITIIRIPYTHTNITIDDLLESSSFKIVARVEE